MRTNGEPLIIGSVDVVDYITETYSDDNIGKDMSEAEKQFREYYGVMREGDYQLFSACVSEIDIDGNLRQAISDVVPSFRVAKYVNGKGEDRYVMFDNCLFLMNDEGKTIEAFYV